MRNCSLTILFVVCALNLSYCQQPSQSETVRLVDIIPNSLSWESNQDSEPFLTVDKVNPATMVISAFTPNPIPASNSSPVFISVDDGLSWSLRNIVPIPNETADVTHAMGSNGILYAGALTLTPISETESRPDLDELVAPSSSLDQFLSVTNTRENVDQPFTVARINQNKDLVLVGENYLGAPDDKTASVEISLDSGQRYTPILLEHRVTGGQNGPSVRTSVAKDGTIYAAYFGWRGYQSVDKYEGWITSDVVVARDDNGAIGEKPFEDLIDPSDGKPGRIIAPKRTIHWSNKAALGRERIGSTLSVVVDPNNSSKVYLAWADNMPHKSAYTIHLYLSKDKGMTWLEKWKPVPNAICASLAVSDNGVTAFEYQQLANGRWITHLLQSADEFSTADNTVLANVSGALPSQGLPYLGDYNYLVAVGHQFRGVFAASNLPHRGNFPKNTVYLRSVDWKNEVLLDDQGHRVSPSIDPFYFSVNVIDVTSKHQQRRRRSTQ